MFVREVYHFPADKFSGETSYMPEGILFPGGLVARLKETAENKENNNLGIYYIYSVISSSLVVRNNQ